MTLKLPEHDAMKHTQALERALEQVVEALRGLRYGSVEITVHDGQVVQIERREKVRLDRTE